MTILLVALAALALAFANGANDNSKGVATLIGAGRLDTRAAVRYATGATLLGSAAALVLARGLLDRFNGKGILAPELTATPAFALAVAAAAATMSHRITGTNDGQAFTANLATASLVLLASRFGLPVSTTHVSVGALIGIGTLSGSARWKTIAAIVASWVAVLPIAAALAAAFWLAAAA